MTIASLRRWNTSRRSQGARNNSAAESRAGPRGASGVALLQRPDPTNAGSSSPGRKPVFFEQYSHEPYIAVARFWTHARITPPEETAAEKRTGGERALQAMDRHLTDTPFLVADRYTIADISLYAYTHVAPEGGFELDAYPAIQAWLARVATQPGHVAITD